MHSSIWFVIFNLGWFIVHIKRSHVSFSKLRRTSVPVYDLSSLFAKVPVNGYLLYKGFSSEMIDLMAKQPLVSR